MNNLLSVISLIPEFRKGNHLVYPIDYLLLVAFCTMMCNQTSWHAMEDYAEIHQKDLRKLYFKISGKVLRRYTPSHDVFCAVFRTLSPITFHNAFKSWLLEVYSSVGEHICIDGKTMRGVKKMEPDADCHTVTAYLSRIHASLDQVFISKKSNEVNAIKELLSLIDIEGATVTIDAMGTQRKIAEQIVSQGGDYILCVKDNQKGTKIELEGFFEGKYYNPEIITTGGDPELGHGRIETRKLRSIVDPMRLDATAVTISLKEWPGLRSVHQLRRVRIDKKQGEGSDELSYYISSLSDPGKVFDLIRAHWSIENHLHHTLDVVMLEDQQLKRKNNEAKNFNIMSKIALFFVDKMKEKSGKRLITQFRTNATLKPSELLSIKL